MPAARLPWCRAARAAAVGVLLAAVAAAQPPKGDPPTKAAAVKLPDGTVVFLTKSPDDANPPIDGVLLTPQEYKALTDQLDQLKKLKDAPKAQPPSRCRVAGKVEARGDRAVAVLSLAFQFRTTTPRAVVALGCRGAFPVAAKLGDGKLPVLRDGDDGLAVLIDAAGEHALTLDVEVPVGPRGAKSEPGFELTLPRAAITTLTLAPPAGVKKLTVGVRTAADRPAEFKQTTEDATALAGAAYPLGPAEALSVTWEPPTPAPAAAEAVLTADLDVAVRVSESQVETTATLRLRGPAREWQLALPATADVTAERAGPAPKEPESPFTSPAPPTLIRPTDPAKPLWTFRPPNGGGADWRVTAVTRQLRPKAPDPKSRGPYPVGPAAVPTAARVAGVVKVFAPPAVLVRLKPTADLTRHDAPAEDDLVAVYKFASAAPAKQFPPLLELTDVRAAPVFVRVQPTYTLRPSDAGWRLDATVAVTPVRTEVEQLVVELPTGWQGLEANSTPADLVDGVVEGKEVPGGRQYVVQLSAAQKAFTLTLSATFPVEQPAAGEATLPLPRFVSAVEQGAKLTASVPDGYEVRGTATADGVRRELRPTTPPAKASAAVASVTGLFDKGVTKVAIGWQAYRPELTADVTADVTLSDRQAVVRQVIRLRSADGELRPVMFRGPDGVLGLKTVPPQDQPNLREWVLRPPADAREFTQTVTYAVPIPARKGDPTGPVRLALGLFWTEAATRTETTVRVWGTTGRRVAKFEGPWRELPPEAAADRDALPWLTLAGSGASLPLGLDLADATEAGLPTTTVERALVQAWVDADGKVGVRGRFLLRRWPAAGVDVELPPGAAPDIHIDGKHGHPAATAEPRTYRVAVPERTAGGTLLLDVRYLLPPGRDAIVLPPPRLPGAVFRSPVRWQILVPPESVPLTIDRGLTLDVRWAWRAGLVAPGAATTTGELEKWVSGGDDPDESANPGTDAVTARQPAPADVRVVRVPRAGWVAGCSLAVLLAGLALARLRPVLLGPALALAGVGVVIVAVTWPQPSAQAAGAALPGAAATLVVLAGVSAARWYYRRRVTHLPGFTRKVSPAPSSARATASGSAAVVVDETGSHHPVGSSGT